MTNEGENSNGAGSTQNSVVRTYTEDMAEVLENDTEGLVKKIIHGEEEHEKEKKNLSPESRKNKILVFVGALLIVFALIALAFSIFNQRAKTVPVEKQFVPIIFTDQSAFLEISTLNKDQITQTVLSEVSALKIKTESVDGIYLTLNKQVVGLRRFISLIKSNFAPDSNPVLVNDNFLMGSVDNDFFVLLKVRTTADIFDSLRAWEPKILSDLHGFFGINISADTNYLFTENFADGIVENKNARVLYDKNGQIILMYIFANDNSVIITGSPKAAHEIMLRLAAGQTKQ
jgi:hypothetical protein